MHALGESFIPRRGQIQHREPADLETFEALHDVLVMESGERGRLMCKTSISIAFEGDLEHARLGSAGSDALHVECQAGGTLAEPAADTETAVDDVANTRVKRRFCNRFGGSGKRILDGFFGGIEGGKKSANALQTIRCCGPRG